MKQAQRERLLDFVRATFKTIDCDPRFTLCEPIFHAENRDLCTAALDFIQGEPPHFAYFMEFSFPDMGKMTSDQLISYIRATVNFGEQGLLDGIENATNPSNPR